VLIVEPADLSVLDNISKAVQFWNSLNQSLAHSHTSFTTSNDLYETLRELRIKRGTKTLSPEDVRAALYTLRYIPNGFHSFVGGYARRMFGDLPDVWGSGWTHDDLNAIFEILRCNGTFGDLITTMKIIHQTGNLRQYPDGDCWTKVFASLGDGKETETLRKAKEAWSLMRHYGTEPTIKTFDALFTALCHLPDATNYITDVYRQEMLPSNCAPTAVTIRTLLEAYMTQAPTRTIIEDGNALFTSLLEFKSSKSYDSNYWDPVIKWMLFRGDSLRTIQHTMFEQNSALGRTSQARSSENSYVQSLSRRIPDTQTAIAITSTLDQLVELALRVDNLDAANTIYNEFFPALGASHTIASDELRLATLIRIEDSLGAKSLYDDLLRQGHRVSSTTVLQLLQLLTHHEKPLAIEAQAVFFDFLDTPDAPPETLSMAFATVAKLLLRTGDYPKVRQILQDRYMDRVPGWRNTLSSICLDVISDPSNVRMEPLLPVYHIVQRWAPETITLSHRHNLMQKLLFHGRSDLGLELFHDMRHSDISQPTKQTYEIMLSGCAKTRDAQTLEHIHNALRLDSSIEPDTPLFNSLMLAYNRSRLPEKALAIWEVLSESSRLPDVETASLALDACVRLPRYGLIRARKIWTFMEDNQIEPSSSSYAALLSVFATVGKWDGMLGLLERMDKEKVNAQVLGTAYNCMRRDRKAEIEKWARENRPEVWDFLESIR
jgi:hypothetical protein